MKVDKIAWLVGAMLSLVLLAASCATPVTTTAPSTLTTTAATSKPSPTGAATTKPSGLPQYGGSYTGLGGDPMGWDEAYVTYTNVTGIDRTNETLLQNDWAIGPAGTTQTSWTKGALGRTDLWTGGLAESFELPDSETIIFHIRPGIRWQNIPPVNGREFVAEDARFSLERVFTSAGSYQYQSYSAAERPKSYKVLDKYTLEVKVPSASQGIMLITCAAVTRIYPPEMIKQYGDMKDWKRTCGTGAFMISDYVPSSSLTYVRNPNYWGKDPVGPGKGNQLPYIDGIKALIISDLSTQMAALRTGKIDIIGDTLTGGVLWEDGEQLKKTTPMKYSMYPANLRILWGRMDKAELPFKDLRVRQALNMAVNKQAIVDQFYGGNTQLFSCPWPTTPDYKDIFTPFDQQPQEVKDLFTYNPEKAKKLLADAGYPNGFKTNCITTKDDVDFLSIIREDFLKIGVDMELKQLENTVYMNVRRSRSHEQMIFADLPITQPFKLNSFRIETNDCQAYYENAAVRAAYNEANTYLGRDNAKFNKAIKDITPVILKDAVGVWLPVTNKYIMWWPWVQNYHGESLGIHVKYIWIDQELKKSLTR